MLNISNLSKSYGGQVLYSEGSFFINPGEKVGLVGPNGAGKTSLFRLITGEERPDTGSISKPERMRLAYFSQSVGEMRGRSVLDEVIQGDPLIGELRKELTILENRLENPDISEDEMTATLEKMGDVQTHFEKMGGYDLEHQAAAVLTGLGIMPEDHQKPVEQFSGGWKMRVALAQVLVQRPDIILMDEPTNYLDLESILWLEEWLKSFKGSIFMTCHDREFMNDIVTKIVEVNYKKISVYSGDYDFYEREKSIRREQLIASFDRQQDMLAKEEEFIAKFAARASHAAQVQSRVKKIEKIEKIELTPEEQTIELEFPEPPRSGNDVARFHSLSKSWPSDRGEKLVFAGATGVIRRLERVAVVGVNGAGKSTFLKILCGQIPQTSGVVEIGANVFVGYFSQFSLDVLNPQNTVFEEVRNRVINKSDAFLRNLLAAFLFKADDVDKKISILSGGEKSRLVLACMLTNPLNCLVLDEPTNHLDIKAREVLLNALKTFEGTVLLVSHDRHFLRQVATRVLEIDKGGVQFYEGNFDYYLQKKASLS